MGNWDIALRLQNIVNANYFSLLKDLQQLLQGHAGWALGAWPDQGRRARLAKCSCPTPQDLSWVLCMRTWTGPWAPSANLLTSMRRVPRLVLGPVLGPINLHGTCPWTSHVTCPRDYVSLAGMGLGCLVRTYPGGCEHT